MNKGNLLENMKLDQKKKIRKKSNTFDSISVFYEGRELTPNAFKSGIFLMIFLEYLKSLTIQI